MLTMLNLIPLVSALSLLSLSLVGCDEKTPTSPAAKDESAAHEEEPQVTAPQRVEVAKTGTKFEPPVKPEVIPDGAWMCDMGTVHFASLEKGEGKCPTCGMALKQKGAAGHDGHDHGKH